MADGPLVTKRLIFTRPRGGHVWRTTLNEEAWKPARAAAGVIPVPERGRPYAESRENGMHALRHFYASVLLDAGENIKALAEYLGHSDPGLTLCGLRAPHALQPRADQQSRVRDLRETPALRAVRSASGPAGCSNAVTSGRKPMHAEDGAINLIHLADRPGTSGHSVSVRVLGRCQPGILIGHDLLDCEIVIVADESLNASFVVTLFPEDLEDWEEALGRLEARQFATWLNSGRTPSLRFKPQESGGLSVSVHDGPSTGITVTLPLFVLPPTWAADQRALLTRVREVYPREVVETSPGAYEWRRDRHA